MRKYLLSDQERKVVNKFLESGEKLKPDPPHFRLVKSRLTGLDLTQIEEDLALIKRFKEAVA